MSTTNKSLGALLAIPIAIFAVLVVVLLGVASMGATACTSTAATGGKAHGVPTSLIPIYQQASAKYKLGARGPSILAAINKIETGFGIAAHETSSAGALGWMQFMPATWTDWGTDGNGDGTKDPYNPWDAIVAAARYLKASGAPGNWHDAVFAYNHAEWYVQDVLRDAKKFDVPPGPAQGSAQTCQGNLAPNEAVGRMYEEAGRLDALHLPYVWGGSHGISPIPASARDFDCSSAVSRLLQVGGTHAPTMTTMGLLEWGQTGPGKWVTIYVNSGHTFLEFRFAPPAHRFWGTSGMRPSGFTGPGWIAKNNFSASYLATFEKRHPEGL